MVLSFYMLRERYSTITGKISIATTLLGVFVICFGLVADIPRGNVALADSATTSVTVLNTPPQWAEDAHESTPSSTTTPTNTGSVITWLGSANDSSNDNYFLLICKTSGLPTPRPLGRPDCNGGDTNQWAVSATTTNGARASAATTTTEGIGSQFNAEFNAWFGWVCDGTSPGASCNAAFRQGSTTPGAEGERSPFVVNHRPTFTFFMDNSPTNPGGTVIFYATSSDTDTYAGDIGADQDDVRLFVCRANDFTGTNCGPGGVWATSTFSAANPSTSTLLAIPYRDGTYTAFGFIIDQHGSHAASGGSQGADSSIFVSNVTPTIAAASISLLDTDQTGPLTLTGIATQTQGFSVRYTVTDQNSCQNLAAGSEIISGFTNTYRSGITQAGCDIAGEYNANNCYPGPATTTVATHSMNCVASSTSCLGSTDSDVIWDCTFPLWYISEATDGNGVPTTDPPNFAENWLASARAFDDNASSSSLVESTSGTELTSFLAYTVSTTTIAYGGLQPGQDTVTVGNTAQNQTGLRAAGNVGMDETLYGVNMCPGYPAACSGNATSTIFIANQRYASSTLAYGVATVLLANPGAEIELNVPKSTSVSVQASSTTHWGIAVPIAITLSGDYLGQNTLIGIVGERANW